MQREQIKEQYQVSRATLTSKSETKLLTTGLL